MVFALILDNLFNSQDIPQPHSFDNKTLRSLGLDTQILSEGLDPETIRLIGTVVATSISLLGSLLLQIIKNVDPHLYSSAIEAFKSLDPMDVIIATLQEAQLLPSSPVFFVKKLEMR